MVAITPAARAFLTPDRPVAVLHVFDGVVNLTDAGGRVLSLQRDAAALAPFGWAWDGAWPAGVTAETPALVAGGALHLGRQRLAPGDAPVWNPVPDWAALRRLDPALLRPAHVLPDGLAAPLAALVAALGAGDGAGAAASAARLVGRGPGLTPAGDDILVGIFHALAVWYLYTPAATALAAVPHPGRTTTLSLAFLRAAAARQAAAPWHDLCRGTAGALQRLLSSGATSGRDAWTGFSAAAAVLRPLFEKRDG